MRSIERWTDIAQEVQVTISLVRQGGSEADSAGNPHGPERAGRQRRSAGVNPRAIVTR
jgi:hypothetical protein